MSPIKNLQLLLPIKKCIYCFVIKKKRDMVYVFNNSLLRCTFCYSSIRLQKSISQSYTQGIKDMPIWVWKRYSTMILYHIALSLQDALTNGSKGSKLQRIIPRAFMWHAFRIFIYCVGNFYYLFKRGGKWFNATVSHQGIYQSLSH